MATQLTNADLLKAATDLGCEVAVIRAVDQVESSGKGFDTNGELVVRFESAVFKKYAGVTITGSNRAAYQQASNVAAEAAMLSTSFGRYQIMGFNYNVCGYSSVQAFVADLQRGEDRHLAAFVTFCKKITYKKISLAVYLQRLDFDSFKNGYNGTGANDYANKIRTAYSQYRQEPALDPAVLVKKKTTSGSIRSFSSCASPCSAPECGCTIPISGVLSGKPPKIT